MPSWRLLAYANGNLGKSALASMMDIYALYFCTEVLGLPPALAGGIVLASMALDAFADPLIGYLADRRLRQDPGVVRYFLFGVPATASAFLLFFFTSRLAPQSIVGFALCMLFVFRVAYALIDVPHNSLLSVMATTSSARVSVASWRIFFSSAGKLAVTGLSAVAFAHFAPNPEMAINITAIGMVGVFLVSLTICTAAVRPLHFNSDQLGMTKVRFLDVLLSLRREKLLRAVFLLTAVNSLVVPGIAVAIIYIARYEFGGASAGAYAILAQAIAQAASLVFWSRAVAWLGCRRRALEAAYALLVLVCFWAMVGLHSMPWLVVTAIGTGFAMGGIFMLNWALLPDALERARESSQTGAIMSYFGTYTIVSKAFHGLAQSLAGGLLGIVGFSAGIGFAEGAGLHFRLGAFAAPVIGGLICLLLLKTAPDLGARRMDRQK